MNYNEAYRVITKKINNFDETGEGLLVSNALQLLPVSSLLGLVERVLSYDWITYAVVKRCVDEVLKANEKKLDEIIKRHTLNLFMKIQGVCGIVRFATKKIDVKAITFERSFLGEDNTPCFALNELEVINAVYQNIKSMDHSKEPFELIYETIYYYSNDIIYKAIERVITERMQLKYMPEVANKRLSGAWANNAYMLARAQND